MDDKQIIQRIETALENLPPEVYRDSIVVAGGCFASLLWDEEPHDFDIFGKFKGAIGGATRRVGNLNLCTKWYGAPSEITDLFDFLHCKAWYTPSNGKLNIPGGVRLAALRKELVYCPFREFIPDPVGSFHRALKFAKEGYTWIDDLKNEQVQTLASHIVEFGERGEFYSP